MYTELKRKIVKCRKKHQCAWCGENITIGESAEYRSYIFDDDFVDDWMHPECDAACSEVAIEEGEFDFVPGDFPRGSTRGY